jgi:hypothetical protein
MIWACNVAEEEKTMTKRGAMIAMLQEPGRRFRIKGMTRYCVYHEHSGRFVYVGEDKNYTENPSLWENSGWQPYVEPVTFDWSCLPPWMNYISMDKDGVWSAYVVEPKIAKGYWMNEVFLQIVRDYEPKGYTGDWKDSIMQRPEGE